LNQDLRGYIYDSRVAVRCVPTAWAVGDSVSCIFVSRFVSMYRRVFHRLPEMCRSRAGAGINAKSALSSPGWHSCRRMVRSVPRSC